VFENRVLRKILGPRRDETTEDWRRLHNEELCDLYSSPNIMSVIKIKQGMSHVWERKRVYRDLVLKREREKDYLTIPGVNERKILKWNFKKWDWGLDWIDLAQDRDR
jgi:hypothetical protein